MVHVLAPHGLPQSRGFVIEIRNTLIEGALHEVKFSQCIDVMNVS